MFRCEDFNNVKGFFDDIRDLEGAYMFSMGRKSEEGLRLSLNYAINEINAKHNLIPKRERNKCFKAILKAIKEVNTEISKKLNQELEIEILKEFKEFVLEFIITPNNEDSNFNSEIFINKRRYKFFLDTF